MKKILASIALFMLLASSALAQSGGATGRLDSGGATGANPAQAQCAAGQLCNPIKASSVGQLVELLMKAIIEIGSIVAVFFIIWSGLKFVMAKGDPGKLDEAKTTLLYTLIGIAILFGARLIAALITGTVENVGAGLN